jgi:hypothetical protein
MTMMMKIKKNFFKQNNTDLDNLLNEEYLNKSYEEFRFENIEIKIMILSSGCCGKKHFLKKGKSTLYKGIQYLYNKQIISKPERIKEYKNEIYYQILISLFNLTKICKRKNIKVIKENEVSIFFNK